MIVEAHTTPAFKEKLSKASLILADGKPVAIACNWLHNKKQERIAGMDFLPAILDNANNLKARVFFYGSTDEVLDKIKEKIHDQYPDVTFAGAISPPFRPLSPIEIEEHITQINQSGANFIFIALGCPKQENWMATHYKSIEGILLGVGGAVPVFAGTQKRSPVWMQNLALEWLYRLLQEPRRMFKRYLYTNSYYIYLLFKAKFKGGTIKP
ncbi:MAG: WecB/TagA/CpsF family glycosyltransferase [Chitinophagaceae bacterium]